MPVCICYLCPANLNDAVTEAAAKWIEPRGGPRAGTRCGTTDSNARSTQQAA
jgi:hypothetical protein